MSGRMVGETPHGGEAGGVGTPASKSMVEATGLVRDYATGARVVHALRGLDLAVARGEMLAIRGRSGSGKTTLLNLLGGLDRPTSGSIRIDDVDITTLSDDRLEGLRRTMLAFVFQSFGLIPFLSAAENVEIPLRLVDTEPVERDARVRHLLELVGLGDRARHRPHELSGGEQQRVAIARALANRPRLLLADEPTGQLDSETGHHIMLLLQAVVRSERVTAIVATHDPLMLDVADRVVQLHDGRLVTEAPAGGSGPAGRWSPDRAAVRALATASLATVLLAAASPATASPALLRWRLPRWLPPHPDASARWSSGACSLSHRRHTR